MAKKKSKGKQQQTAPLSPQRFMREKARKQPIDKCYVSPTEWKEAGMASVIVSRRRANGNLVVAVFLVDTFCLGVKDALFNADITSVELQGFLNKYKYDQGLEEISYEEAHNIVYGAIEFAREGGIEPAKDFDLARYILEEDTDDIPLIEYEYGKDGKHLLIVSPDGKEMPYLHILKQNLGDDFEYIMPYGEEEYEDDEEYEDVDDDEENFAFPNDITPEMVERALKNMKKMEEETNRLPDEVYSYQYPQYPQTLSVKHQFIADELLSPDNYSCLPRNVIERILALPKDEAASDISNIILYEIGRTYKDINDNTIQASENSVLIHALLLLAHIGSSEALNAVIEILHQNMDFSDYHLGDFAPEYLKNALYACGMDNIAAIEEFLNQPGFVWYARSHAASALAMIAFNHPERRKEIIEVFRRLLTSMVTRLPIQEACDGTFAGVLMCTLLDINAKELIPEIKAVFKTRCVDRYAAGDCKKVVRDMNKDRSDLARDKYTIPDIYEENDRLKAILQKPE